MVGAAAMLAVMPAVIPARAEAATRALVVGVSGYPNLAESLRLRGPKNDTREFANTMVRLGLPASDITILADGISGLSDNMASKADPTKEAILDELDRLTETSVAGDLVVFYFSGHGSQTTDLDGDEQGGNDEIFLPYDVGKYENGAVKNALVDDELNVRIRRILDKGVDFFGVIDACHSATGFRALDEDESRARRVSPSALGVPEVTAMPGKPAFAALTANRPAGSGRAAFFYAAQEVEVAREQKPKNADDGEFYGVFTFNLLKRLNTSAGLTYRTLHQAVIDDIKRGNLMSSQTPELEGDMLDEPFLNLSTIAERRQWQAAGGKVQAGELAGLTAGTIVGLYADPADPDDKPVAHGRIVTAGATKSVVEPVVYPCAKEDDAGYCTTEPDMAAYRNGRFARILQPGLDLTVALSEPIRIDASDGQDYTQALAALRAAVAEPGVSRRVELRSDGYDIAVALVDGKLAFAPSAGLIDANGPGSSPRLTLPADGAEARSTVAAALDRIAKATALQRLAGGSKDVGLRPSITLRKAKTPAADGACSEDTGDYEAAVAVGDFPRFAACDIISVTMANDGKKPLDVTVLLVGSDFSITPVWPVDGEANRIQIGESKSADILQADPKSTATTEERLVFITVPGVSKSHTAFTQLGQAGVRASVGDQPPEVAAVRDLLATGLNEMTRSATSGPKVDEEMSIDILPFFAEKAEGS